MGIVQLEHILRRDDVPPDVKEVVISLLDENKRNKEALKKSKVKIRSILEATTDLMFQVNKDGMYLSYKGAKEDLYAAPEEFLGKKIGEVMPKEIAEQTMHCIEKTIQTGVKQLLTLQIPIDGKNRTFESRMVPCGEDEVLTIVHEITKKETLREIEERLRALMNSAPDNMILWDSKLNYVELNKKSIGAIRTQLDLLITKEEIIGKNILEINPSLKGTDRYNAYKEVLRTGIPFIQENTKFKDRFYYVRAFKAGTGMGMITTDVTEKRRTEIALRERVKELTCLYGLSRLTSNLERSIDEIIHQTIKLIPPAWQYPEITCARINLEETTYNSITFQETPWKQSTDIMISGKKTGAVEVYYLVEKPEIDEGPFLKEERDLIDAIAREIGEYIGRKQVKEDLRESEERYRTIFQNSPVGIEYYDADGTLIDLNTSCLEIFGISSIKDVSGFDLFNDPNVPEQGLKNLRAGKNVNYEADFDFEKVKQLNLYETSKSGTIITDVQITPLVLSDYDSPIGYLVYVQDITHRKQAEEGLRKSEEKYRYFFNNAQVALFRTRISDGKLLDINELYAKILGYKNREQCLAEYHPSFHTVDNRSRDDYVSEIGKQQENALEFQAKRRDGSLFWISLSSRIYPERDCIEGGGIDITNQKLAEQARKESEEKFRKIFEDSPIGMAIVGASNEIIEANQKLCNMLNYSLEEIKSLTFPELSHPDDIQKDLLLTEKLVNGEVPFFNLEKRYLTKDKKVVWGNLTATAVFNDKSNFIYGVGMVEDITSKKQAERALQESEEKYRIFFEEAPISLWEEDYSGIRGIFDQLRQSGVNNFREYFENHPEVVQNCAAKIKIIEINRATLHLYKAKNKEELFSNFDKLFNEESLESIKEAMSALAEGKTYYSGEAIAQSLKGEILYLKVAMRIFPGYEESLSRILLSVVDITEQKLIEQELRESEERLRAFMNSSTDIISIFDSGLNYIDVNQVAVDLVGLPKEEIIGKNILDLFLYLKGTKRYTDFQSVIKTGEPVILDDIIIPERFGETHFLIRAFKVGNGLGTMTTDITKLIKAEEALRRSEEKYRRLFELMPIGLGISDLNSRILHCNKRTLEIMGYTSEEIKDVVLKDTYVYPEERDKAIKILQETGKLDDFETQLTRKDGTEYTSLLNIEQMELDGQTVLFTAHRDITQRKELTKALQKSEERLRAFMDSATDGFILFDSQLNYIDLNKVALATNGFTKEEMVGKNILDFFPNLKDSDRYLMYKKVLQSGVPFNLDSVLIKGKYYSIRAFKVGEGLGVMTLDVTEIKHVEKTREILEGQREKFIWMTSHELRTPLTVIKGYVNFMEKNISIIDHDRQGKVFRSINSNLSRLERLIDEVSLVAQFERGIFEIQKSAFDFSLFFQDAKNEYQTLLGEQFIADAFQLEFPLIINADQNRLRQVLDNVVNNAIHHTHTEHRKIKLDITISPLNIRIICTDNGAGIEPANIERIFEQFLSIETEFATAGTGIGLYLSRKIMEAHGGSLIAQSQGHGHGASFIIEIPLENLK